MFNNAIKAINNVKMTPKIPLILKLKKARHKNIARAQDIVVEELYRVFERAVLHGGTAIWRCYNGNRFSEDVDVYIPKDIKKINLFFRDLEKKGFKIEKKKISENSLYSNLELEGTTIRFEALFKDIRGSLKEYETAEGNLITIYTLIPEEIIKEKIDAYFKRFKIRDLYDVFFLLRHVKNKNLIEKDLKKLVARFKIPTDKTELKVLIIEGLVPDMEKMLMYIKREA